MRETRSRVQVVVAEGGQSLNNASVRLEPETSDGAAHDLPWDGSQRCYFGRGVKPGLYRLIAARGNDREEQRVQVRSTGLRTIVLFNPRGLDCLHRGPVKTPFEQRPDLLAVALDERMPDGALEKLSSLAKQEGLSSAFCDWNGMPPRHARVFKLASAESRETIVQKLADVGGVHPLGPIVHFVNQDSISCLTDELVIRFRPGAARARIEEFAEHRKLTLVRELIVAKNTFVFRMAPPLSYETLPVANAIARCELVLYAEPNLISIGSQDAAGPAARLEPRDFLFPMQWHLPRIRCPEAWRMLHDRISPNRAMGSPAITLAVVDWGIDTDHPEFAGRVSNGEPKVSVAFDFHNMRPGNAGRNHGHGTCCAGVATALADNGGVCGVAGNCRLMAIRRPEGLMATETAYSDMYLWIAGLDPRSPAPGFPQRIRRGADVISNSFGYAAGLPISGLMQDTFDVLTERGRNGRGVLLFFSAGNSGQDFTLERPWAAHDRTLAVTASTLASGGNGEIRPQQASLGNVFAMLDFCAPSASSQDGSYNPPTSYAIITAADRCSADPDHNLQPNAPAECSVRTTLLDDAEAGALAPAVISTEGFAIGQFVLIGRPGADGAEFNQIAGILDAGHLRLKDALTRSHPRGTPIIGGPAYWLHSFSGTSCSTAIAAGVGALLLSACPSLEWDQIRDILRGTAVKIDEANSGATGWRKVEGVRYSAWYGFGRIDALAAVQAALARRPLWAKAVGCLKAGLQSHRCGGGDTQHRQSAPK